MDYILTSIKAQLSFHHLYDVAKSVFSVVGLLITVLQGAEYMLPAEFVSPIVAFLRENTLHEISAVLFFVVIFKWKNLDYIWKCKAMEVTVEIKCCDFFRQDGCKLIQFADTFDTDFSVNKLVKPTSVNGQFISRFYRGRVQKLDEIIEKTLRVNKVKGTENNLLKGKKQVYGSGTVIPVATHNQNFILVAFSRMRPNGTSSMSKISYTDFLTSLWQKLPAVNLQDETLNVTVFGASSISGLPADFKFQDKLHEIIKSFLLASKNRRICKKLRICMRPEDYQQLDYEDCKLLAAYFDSHLSQTEVSSLAMRNRRGKSFNPPLN